jgi:hypothetical protein
MSHSCSLSLKSRVAFSVVTCLLYFFSQWFEPILSEFFTRAIRGEPPAQEAIIFEFFRWFLL